MGCIKESTGSTRVKVVRGHPCQPISPWPYPSAQDLVDGSTLLERALCYDLGSHLLHVQHEGVEGLLDGWLLGLLLYLGFCLRLPEGYKSRSIRSPPVST